MLTDNQMQDNRNAVISLLESTGRKGIESVINHLVDGGFFNVPASIHHHNNFEGGLAKHSLEVYHEAMNLYESFTTKIPFLGTVIDSNSIILCALLHDVCKMDVFYMRNGKPQGTGVPNNPHGKKSVRLLLEWGLELFEDEQLAIAWHMGRWTKDGDCKIEEVESRFLEVQKTTPLASFIRRADSLASSKAIEEQINDE
jgi:hypothetical protein